METHSLGMHDFNFKARVYWWVCTAIGSGLIVWSLIGLGELSLDGWIRLAMLATLVLFASRRPLHIPNTEASVSVSDAFVFLGLFFLGTGPAILLGSLDNYIAARKTARRAASWILAPNLMAMTVLVSSTAFRLTLSFTHKGESPWPIGVDDTRFAALFPALIILALAQYITNGWLVAWFYAIRASKSVYHFWRSGYLWTSCTFFASAIAAGLIYLAVERHGFICVAAAVPIIVASYLTYKVYFDRLDENKQHLEEMSRLHLATVEALASAIDAKDQTTHGHVRRVQIYAEGLAKLFKLSVPEIEALKAGALLHDIGKLAVPDHILNKPAKLTAAEFEKMKIHTIVGAQILERVGFPYPVVPIVRYHHERWDGNGYPDGLAGEQIPVTARILSVVDCFDALHEDRQYRRALNREEAIEHLQRAAGSQFDPQIVKAFIEHLREFETEIAAQQVENETPLPDIAVLASGALPAAGLSSERKDSAERPSYMSHISRAHQEVYALYEVARTFGSSLNIEDAMAIIANKLGYVVTFDTCVIYRFHESSGIAIAEHVSGLFAEHLRHRCVCPGEGITGYVLANRKPFTHTDPMLDFVNINLPTDVEFTACAVLPLIKQDRLLGVLALYSTSLTDYTEDDLRLLETVARIAADALDNAIRYAATRSDALTDLLTGVPNSRALQLRFEQDASRAEATNSPFYLLMLDLDGFKPINDTYGHQIGDDFLRSISQMLLAYFDRLDFFARYAGDEFVALVSHLDDRKCQELCARLQRAVERFAFCVRPMKYVQVGISIGAALYGRDGKSMNDLIVSADRAMYANKQERRVATGTSGNVIYLPRHSDGVTAGETV
ncbi:MAG TPA: HD domain-containing phosphohydrolase [Blastocatellia bacterium]|nr:HD domain-containing phosphohydrolase [Blastocatellia bacterium]